MKLKVKVRKNPTLPLQKIGFLLFISKTLSYDQLLSAVHMALQEMQFLQVLA